MTVLLPSKVPSGVGGAWGLGRGGQEGPLPSWSERLPHSVQPPAVAVGDDEETIVL